MALIEIVDLPMEKSMVDFSIVREELRLARLPGRVPIAIIPCYT